MSKSSTTTTSSGRLHNPHPGKILLEEFLKPMGLSHNALARAVDVAPRRIKEIVWGKRDITAHTRPAPRRLFRPVGGLWASDLMQRRREIDRDLKTIRPRSAEDGLPPPTDGAIRPHV